MGDLIKVLVFVIVCLTFGVPWYGVLLLLGLLYLFGEFS